MSGGEGQGELSFVSSVSGYRSCGRGQVEHGHKLGLGDKLGGLRMGDADTWVSCGFGVRSSGWVDRGENEGPVGR